MQQRKQTYVFVGKHEMFFVHFSSLMLLGDRRGMQSVKIQQFPKGSILGLGLTWGNTVKITK